MRRTRSAWRVLGLAVVLAALVAPAARTLAASKHCKAGEVRRTVTYAKRPGAHKRTVTGCGARAPKNRAISAPGSTGLVAPVLRHARLQAVQAAPRRVARLFGRPAARRVLGADGVTDRAADEWFAAKAGGGAHAASSVQTGSDNGPSSGVPQGPAGTRTTMQRSGTEWGDATPNASTGVVSSGDGPEQNPGFDSTIATQTAGTRIQGLSSRMSKRTRIKVRLSRCPDAAGVGQGPVLYEETSTQTIDKPDGGHAVITSTSTYEGTLKAQFGDDARLVSTDLSGDWSYATETRVSSGRGGAEQRVSRRSVGGTSKDNRLGPGGNSLTVAVSNASDDTTAMGGDPTGKWVSGIIPPSFAQEPLDRLAKNTIGGACVRVVADPKSLSLRPGDSATIKAHPVDSHGGFAGHLTSYLTGGTLTPSEANANPEASFTFIAPSGKQPGDHDTIVFNHVSRRGKANGTQVDVTYLPAPLSHTYRVMAATLAETVTGQRPGSSFPGCPDFSSRQDNTMTLGAQAAPTGGFATQGHLLPTPQGYLGILIASGAASAATTLHGCDLTTFGACTNTGSGTITRDVSFQITLPPTGPATIRWTFGFDPTAGLGSEGAGGHCFTPPIGWTTNDFAMGDQSVPRSVFESSAAQHLTYSLAFDVTDPNPAGPAQIHASDRYTMTIQRVRDDGTPL